MKKSIKALSLVLAFLAVLFIGYSIGLHKSDDAHKAQVETLQKEVKDQRTNVKTLKKLVVARDTRANIQLVEINELAKTIKKLTPDNLELTVPVYGVDFNVNELAKIDAKTMAKENTQLTQNYFKCLK